MPSQKPTSLFDVWVEYEEYVRATMPPKKAEASLAQTRTALLRYTLPRWVPSFSSKGQRLTSEEIGEGLDKLKQLELDPITCLESAAEAQEKVFDDLQVPGNSRRNYRWALKKFLDWSRQQPWIGVTVPSFSHPPPSSRKRKKKGSATDVRLTTRKLRKNYKLTEDELSEPLQQELDDFYQWMLRSESAYSRRYKLDSEYLLRILGWLYRVQKIPLEQLSLDTLITFIPINSTVQQAAARQQAKQAATSFRSMVLDYFRWLGTDLDNPETVQYGPRSLQPEIGLINTLLSVARFRYRHEVADHKQDEALIPLINELHNLKAWLESLRGQHSNLDSSKKWLDWFEFLDFVEQLRKECVPRFIQNTQSSKQGVTLGSLRTATAIAQSYQRFLLAALLAYIPPQRQQVLRSLTFTLQSSVDNLEPSGNLAHHQSLICKKEKIWLLKVPRQKKESDSPDLELILPNIQYPDNQQFYQYLEEWLLHYCYQESENKSIEFSGLRHCFNPKHSSFFTMKNGQHYNDATVFADLLSNPAFRITGKVVSPDSVRDMLITHLLKSEVSYSKLMETARLMDYEPEKIEKIMYRDMERSERQTDYLTAAIAQAFLQE